MEILRYLQFVRKHCDIVLKLLDLYGGNKFQTFVPDSGGAPPIETTLSLAFNELEIVVRDVKEPKDTDPTIQSGY